VSSSAPSRIKPVSPPATTPVVPALLQRKCACGGSPGADGECSECRKKRLQRKTQSGGAVAAVPPVVHDVLRSPGQPLDQQARSFLEPRFGHDFSRVRVHTDDRAAQSAAAVDALAYTVGTDIVFASGQYAPERHAGLRILSHELTHVIQQRNATRGAGGEGEIELGGGEAAEREADQLSATVMEGRGGTSAVLSSSVPSLMRLTSAQFRRQLGSTPEQTLTLDNVFGDASFLGLWSYMGSCAATPTQDLGPLALAVTPGLRIGGVERFGGYSPMARQLEINPTKPEHVSNPAELADTLVHEFIHAVDDLETDCVAAGAPPAPLAGAATAHPPSRSSVAGTPREASLMQSLGPGASNPCEEFIDINSAAQQMIVQILSHTIQSTGVGRPTLIFVNEILRGNPAAMTAYESCRTTACALSTVPARRAAVADCSTRVIGQFIPASLQAALLPAQVQFDSGSSVLRPDTVDKLTVISLFLISSGNSVTINGNTDPVGSAPSNMTLGQSRAEAVARELRRQGVPAAQIRSVTSAGESRLISSAPAEFFRDRRVEISL
jgi:outer membrane protein OmpA-like peptidoglycan-associated protein